MELLSAIHEGEPSHIGLLGSTFLCLFAFAGRLFKNVGAHHGGGCSAARLRPEIHRA
jgi:hypothetical protein